MQIWFDTNDFKVYVSSHGYFLVFSKKLPILKITGLEIYSGTVGELGHSISYEPDHDDLNVDLKGPILKNAVDGWVNQNLSLLKEMEESALILYEEKKRRFVYNHPKIGKLKIGDEVILWGKAYKIRWIGWSIHAKFPVLVLEDDTETSSIRADHPDLKKSGKVWRK
ncbi:MAG: hypothetical protein AB1488_07810 [Nitrospirota bacterium]